MRGAHMCGLSGKSGGIIFNNLLPWHGGQHANGLDNSSLICWFICFAHRMPHVNNILY